MLSDITNMLQQYGPMSRAMIARELKSTESAVDEMLKLLISRGKIKKLLADSCAGGCCSNNSVDLYQWQGQQALPINTQLD